LSERIAGLFPASVASFVFFVIFLVFVFQSSLSLARHTSINRPEAQST
jgi:hypothetical protein